MEMAGREIACHHGLSVLVIGGKKIFASRNEHGEAVAVRDKDVEKSVGRLSDIEGLQGMFRKEGEFRNIVKEGERRDGGALDDFPFRNTLEVLGLRCGDPGVDGLGLQMHKVY